MEILSVGDDTSKKKLLLEELKRYGVIFNVDEALKAPEYTLQRLLQEAKSKQHTSTTTQDLFMDVYESMITRLYYQVNCCQVYFFSRAILGLPYSRRLFTTTITRDLSSKYAHQVQKHNLLQFKIIF